MTKTKLIALFAATILFVFCLFGCKNPENIKPESDENLLEIIIGSDEYRPFFLLGRERNFSWYRRCSCHGSLQKNGLYVR